MDSIKRAEENEQDLHNMVLQSPIGICILDAATLVSEVVNDSFIEIAGKKKEEIIGNFYWDTFAEAKEEYEAALNKVVKEGTFFHVKDVDIMLIRHGREENLVVTFVYTPLKDADGNVRKVAVWVIDDTQQVSDRNKIRESEEKLNMVIDASDLGTWELDLKNDELTYSKRYLEIFGYNKNATISHIAFIEQLHPEDLPVRDRAFEQAFVTGYLNYQARIIWKDASVHWIEVRGKIFYDSRHNQKKLLGTIMDITEEKSHQQRLQESELKFRNLSNSLEKQVQRRVEDLESLNESLRKSEERYHLMVEEVQEYAILYLNKEGNIENWNKGAQKIKGYSADEIIGKNFSTFYTKEDRNNNLPFLLLNMAAELGRAVQQGWRVRKDGSLFWASVVITAVHNEENEVIGFSKVTHDLTEKKKADDELKAKAEELEQKNAELERMNKELQSFAYISSHDLQEPLRKIQTFSSRILEKEFENLSEKGKEGFLRMQNAASRMQTLIRDLLGYSRANSPERDFERRHLKDIVEEVREDLKEELEQKQATIEVIDPCEATIIPFQMRQLLYNLISNSLKFSRKDQSPNIIVTCKTDKGQNFDNNHLDPYKKYCHIKVSDNGIGFDQQFSEKIFELFQRLHGKDAYYGTGIGLAIVKKIVENHNGVIFARSELNKGAEFDIYLPEE